MSPIKRKWVARHPERYTYQNIKNRARQRGKNFELTHDQWLKFCRQTGYLHLRGRGKFDYSVDCIVAELGYVEGNIQLLRNDHHLKKSQEERRSRKGWSVRVEKLDSDPF